MKDKYCYSTDGENYSGEFNTLEELKTEVGDDFKNIKIGKYTSRITVTGTGEDFCTWLDEMTSQNCGANLEESIFDYCEGSVDELASAIDKVITDFFDKHPIDYWIVEECDEDGNVTNPHQGEV